MSKKSAVMVRTVDTLRDHINQIESLVRLRAYHRFVARGHEPGLDQDDWYCARAEALCEPPITMAETDKQITVVLSLTDAEPLDLEILSTHESLLIRGTMRSTGEMPHRLIHKVIHMPRAIDPSTVDAEYQIGTLRCTATPADVAYFLRAKGA